MKSINKQVFAVLFPLAAVLPIFLGVSPRASAQEQTSTNVAPPESTENAKTESETKPKRPYSVTASLGIGQSMNDYQEIQHLFLAIQLPVFTRVEAGAYLSQDSAIYHQIVDFPSTGYQENRNYKLTALNAGFSLSSQLRERLFLNFSAGLSRTVSSLESLSTTAPASPSLQSGRTSEPVWNFAYRTGISYEYPLKSFGLGAEIGSSSTSANSLAEIKDTFGAFYIKYYANRPAPPPTPPPAPTTESSETSEEPQSRP